jgi:hypothetical protein
MKLAAWGLFAGSILMIAGCGGKAFSTPPVVLTVSLSNTTIDLQQGSTVSVPVVIVAPTETATFNITGLPPGVSQSYKESESNPSGLLTLTANASASLGTYMPTITVGSSGQTATQVFTLVVGAQSKTGVSGKEVLRLETPDRASWRLAIQLTSSAM